MSLYYGQIRAGNYHALLDHYGHPPPWPMERCPHVSLVRAVMQDLDPRETDYYDYLKATHHDAAPVLHRQAGVVRDILNSEGVIPIDVEFQSVVDGNHRTAVAVVTGRELQLRTRKPYQSLRFPDGTSIPGRRYARGIPVDVQGKRVMDIGCCDGVMSIEALLHGASSVLAVDRDVRSTPWQLREAWKMEDKMEIEVLEVGGMEAQDDVDVVIACSVVQHIGVPNFTRLTRGKTVLFENHLSGQLPPDTGHDWRFYGSVPYSAAEPLRTRDVYVGTP